MNVIESPGVYIFHKRECDPKKCTALKLGRQDLANIVYHVSRLPFKSLLLYPFCDLIIAPVDHDLIEAYGLSAVDCSWNRIAPVNFTERFNARQLPFLLAANPTNYAIPYRLSTLEALAGALIITGYSEYAHRMLKIVKWGPTFLTLNSEPLTLYSAAKSYEEVKKIDEDYRSLYSGALSHDNKA